MANENASFGVNTQLFLGFTEDDLRVLAPAVTRRELVDGEVVCRRGEPGSSLYIIRSGSLQVRRPADETDVALARLGPGEACGEMALVTDGLRTADIVAAEPSVILEVSREALGQALAGHPDVAAKLWHNLAVALADRLASTNTLLARSIERRRQGA